MCFGGGKSADAYYQEMKKDYGPLPSLRSPMKKRKEQKLGDVQMRSGAERRSLLNPYLNQDQNNA